MTNDCLLFGRRSFLAGGAALGGLAATGILFPAWAQSGTGGIAKPLPTRKGTDIAITIHRKIGRASGRERVCQYVEHSVVDGAFNIKINTITCVQTKKE